jgi:hypothetical protein
MLILLVGALFFGGSAAVIGSFGTGHAIDELQSRLTRVIKDPGRAKGAQRVLEQWKEEGKAYEKATAASRQAILKLAHRHDATRAEVEAAHRAIDARDEQTIERFIAVREALKEHLNGDEWAAVFGP